ncbi:MAG: two pore domain potassium channel family protein [Ruminiclostridium sp.]|nr:two pore domain potassium channel family protein [Ruminiclostridium sp.]
MEKKKLFKSKRFFRVLETIVLIISFSFALQLLVNNDYQFMSTVFALNACANFLGLLSVGRSVKVEFVKNLVYTISFAIISMLLATLEDSPLVLTICCTIYLAVMDFSCLTSIIKKKKKANFVVNIIAMVLWTALLTLILLSDNYSDYLSMFALGYVLPWQMLYRVTKLSFAHIRYDILVKVIRKSMALEILSGLMILIVSFSFALFMIEPDMETYGDALWYCFAIVTTIGFGDMSAVTILGRILSVLLGIYGIIVVSLITSVIVNFYTELNKETEEKNAEAERVKAKKEAAAKEEVEKEEAASLSDIPQE